jgi:hypothetical protein
MEINMDGFQGTTTREPAAILRAAFSDLVTAGLEAVNRWLDTERHDVSTYDDPPIRESTAANDIEDSAELLGVSIDATADEIRAAFRAKVKAQVNGGVFHDQIGGTTDPNAQQLIIAKNTMIEHCLRAEVA